MEVEKRPLKGPAKERFRALLKLASESPFEGERENALAAASRLAEQHGLTLDEAARPTERFSPAQPDCTAAARERANASEFAKYFDTAERNLRADTARREEALRDAIARGLDKDKQETSHRTGYQKPQRSSSKRNPRNYAQVLLTETAFSLDEIVGLTGLDIYEVVGLKLKMRPTA